jgi:hypothetical protein
MVFTLETPVWGKPAKRGFLLASEENNTAANYREILTAQKSALFLTSLPASKLALFLSQIALFLFCSMCVLSPLTQHFIFSSSLYFPF